MGATEIIKDFNIQGLNGVMVGNPPYGERIGELEEAEEITRDLGNVMKNHPSWSVYMISPLENFETLYGKKRQRNESYLTDLFERIIISIGANVNKL